MTILRSVIVEDGFDLREKVRWRIVLTLVAEEVCVHHSVEQKQVVALHHHDGEREPSLLASGEAGDLRQDLDATANQAHELAKVLRDKKIDFEAYVLHTRHNSIVTVGSFSGPRDPKMQQTAEKLLQLKLVSRDPKHPTIQFFAEPMEIPRPE